MLIAGPPADVCFLRRGWLSANHLLLLEADRAWLIDSGHALHAQKTLTFLEESTSLGGRPLDRVINTHCHVDHAGGNATLKQRFKSAIYIPAGSTPDEPLARSAGLFTEGFVADGLISSRDSLFFGLREWVVLDAPGHDMNALMFYCPALKLLASGDALWQGTTGFLIPTTDEKETDSMLDAAESTLDTIAGLDVALVVPGHGDIFGDVAASIASARRKLQALRRDHRRMAWLAMKAMLSFSLLESNGLTFESLQQHVRQTAFYVELDLLYFKLGQLLVPRLIDDLLSTGSVIRHEERLVSCLSA